MKWSDIGNFLGKAAPLIGMAVGGPAGPAIGAIISHALGTDNTPDAVHEALKSDPEALAKVKQAELEHATEIKRIILENETKQLQEINATYRTELASSDPYVRRMRPTFGYVVAATLMIQTLALIAGVAAAFSYGIDLTLVLNAVKDIIGEVAMIDAPAMGVLGIYVKKRSDDKAVAKTGENPLGIVGAIAKRISK